MTALSDNRLKLIRRDVTPPDKYRFTFPDGFVALAVDWPSWVAVIKKHYTDNEIPIPDDWQEIAEDQLCRLLPSGHCTYMDGRLPTTFIDPRFSVNDFISGTKALAMIGWNGEVVAQPEAERRAKICAACPANMLVPGCSACHAVADLVAGIVGARTTEADPVLKACGACLCSNKAQVWIPVETLAATTSEKQMERLSLFAGHCWKWQGIQNIKED